MRGVEKLCMLWSKGGDRNEGNQKTQWRSSHTALVEQNMHLHVHLSGYLWPSNPALLIWQGVSALPRLDN